MSSYYQNELISAVVRLTVVINGISNNFSDILELERSLIMMTKFDLLGKLKELKDKAKAEKQRAKRLAKSGSVATTA